MSSSSQGGHCVESRRSVGRRSGRRSGCRDTNEEATTRAQRRVKVAWPRLVLDMPRGVLLAQLGGPREGLREGVERVRGPGIPRWVGLVIWL